MKGNNKQGISMQQPNDGCNGNSGVPNTNNVGNNNSTSICVAVITGVFGLATAIIAIRVRSKKKNELEDKRTKNKMEVDDHKAWLDIKKNEEKNRQNLESYRAKKKIDQEYKCINRRIAAPTIQISLREWQDKFNSKYPMPEYSAL